VDHFLAICGAVACIYGGDLVVPEALTVWGRPESAAASAAMGAVAGYVLYELLRLVTSRR